MSLTRSGDREQAGPRQSMSPARSRQFARLSWPGSTGRRWQSLPASVDPLNCQDPLWDLPLGQPATGGRRHDLAAAAASRRQCWIEARMQPGSREAGIRAKAGSRYPKSIRTSGRHYLGDELAQRGLCSQAAHSPRRLRGWPRGAVRRPGTGRRTCLVSADRHLYAWWSFHGPAARTQICARPH
jgi:hypothetical protein